MKRNAYLITVFVGLALALGVVGGARAQGGGPVSQQGVGVQAALGTGFTYQGQLQSSGSPVNDSCTFGFGLWDSASGGVQLGVTQTVTTTVTNGLFTATLNDSAQFGGSAFSGSNARYLGIGVKCGSESTLTSLGRQTLNASPYALYARNNWGLSGNSGTSASNFLGTTDNMTLTLAVNNTAALRLVPNGSRLNLIAGYSGNSVSAGIYGATIGGGGQSGDVNTVSGNYGTVSGGYRNSSGYTATVSGGYNNTASGDAATVGGGLGSTASGDYATVGGGFANTASGLGSTVGGGYVNTASGYTATVGGGYNNTASGDAATVGGGRNNSSWYYATVGGGNSNNSSGLFTTIAGGNDNTASGNYATVGGGFQNLASGAGAVVGGGGSDGVTFDGNQALGDASTIGGGLGNVISSTADYAAVGGGLNNTVSANYSTIGGGDGNTVSHYYSVIGGGHDNTVSDQYSVVGGGQNNAVSDTWATIGGGSDNIASQDIATVGGGNNNTASGVGATVGGGQLNTASGTSGTIPGGLDNIASGDYSFAAGTFAHALHDGAFVWADASFAPISSTVANQFLVRASGGITLYTDSGASAGVRLTPGSGTWASLSDKNMKANFAPVDGLDILEQLIKLPIETWNYQTQNASIRHIGPMAQDFYAAFNVGEDDTHITTIDADGVALAAIQGLYQVVREKEVQLGTLRNENADQQQQIDQLQQQNADLQTRVAALEQRSEPPIAIQSPPSPLPWGWLLFGGLLLINLGFLFGRVGSAPKGTQS